MYKSKDLPVYKLLVETVRKGFEALDAEIQQEIRTFIKSRQHKNGAFIDRAGNPDLYYSLFGLWLSMSSEQTELLRELKKYALTIDRAKPGPVERMALILIQSELNPKTERQSIFSLIRIMNQQGKNISLSYRFFLFALLVDAVGKNKAFYFFLARTYLLFYKPKPDFPCSLVAAFIYARKMLGLKVRKSQTQLMEYSLESGGFKAFDTTANSDMLSSAVALFVLNQTKADLRMLRPATLEFVQNNYFEGAFLSGDGDETRDLEYTFYGLLALGSLVN